MLASAEVLIVVNSVVSYILMEPRAVCDSSNRHNRDLRNDNVVAIALGDISAD